MADVAVRGFRHRGELAVIVRPFFHRVQKPVTTWGFLRDAKAPYGAARCFPREIPKRHGGAQGNAAVLRAPRGAAVMAEPKPATYLSGIYSVNAELLRGHAQRADTAEPETSQTYSRVLRG